MPFHSPKNVDGSKVLQRNLPFPFRSTGCIADISLLKRVGLALSLLLDSCSIDEAEASAFASVVSLAMYSC